MIIYPHRDAWNCEEGWFPLIEEMILQLAIISDEEDQDLEISTIKEKFGCLTVYPLYSATANIWNCIYKYQQISGKVCEFCGAIGLYRKDLAWKRTLCETHYKEELIRIGKYYDE